MSTKTNEHTDYTFGEFTFAHLVKLVSQFIILQIFLPSKDVKNVIAYHPFSARRASFSTHPWLRLHHLRTKSQQNKSWVPKLKAPVCVSDNELKSRKTESTSKSAFSVVTS